MRAAYDRGLSRGRQRAEFARLVEVLAGLPWTGDGTIAAWVLRLRGLADEEGPRLARSLLRAYRHGALNYERWAELGGRTPREPEEIDDAVRRLWEAFFAAGLVARSSSENWTQTINPAVVRRWAWQPRWYFMQQDEDLLLMRDELVPTMLTVASDRRTPKCDYLINIVAHHARDSCCQAAYHCESLAATLTRVAAWAPLARAARAEQLQVYLERLGRHAVPGPVDRAGAVQRLQDLGRCGEPRREEVDVREVEGGWSGLIIHSAGNRQVRIDAATGELSLLSGSRGRRRRS